MTIKGIDNGYGYTKDESLNIFRSAFTTKEPISLFKGHRVIIDSTDMYWVGTGYGTVDLNKINTTLNKVCTLTCLGLSPGTDFKIVAGLPINQFNKDKNMFKEILLSYNNTLVQVDDNNEKRIRIHDVAIYPQSVATIYSSTLTDDVILVDVGFRTVDIALIQYTNRKPNLIKSDTYYCGMYSLYDCISNHINNYYNLTTCADDMEHLLDRGLYIGGEKQPLAFLSPVLAEYYEELFSQLVLKYPTVTTPIMLTGGGATFVYKAFLKRFSQTVLHKTNQFSNAQGYYQVGLRMFGGVQ